MLTDNLAHFFACLWALRAPLAFVVVVTAVCLLYVETKEADR